MDDQFDLFLVSGVFSMRRCVWLGVLAACVALSGGEVLAQGGPAAQAVKRMQVAEGLEVRLIASEPIVKQPVAIEFDDHGRLWVIQYLQYPNPAGLKRVQVDRYSRTKYDSIPAPPPRGPRGADRITILADADGDGRMDRGRDFVSGLNLATGFAFGHGGVFVLNVPYLLFYPDRNRDDVPDSDPEVLLSGFGMEDAHSVANSLTWGPDGWLYGCQGSTVTSQIRGIEFQQGVWRYQPQTHKFELFCEGGGNTWGLDFDSSGRLLYSTNFGGYLLAHGVQGGYYVKSFGKHGALHNSHAYGYFEHAPHQNFRGGHVTVGGIVYQGDLFPPPFRGMFIGGDLLGHAVYWHRILPWGSTVRTSHAGELLLANDTWFAPTDVTTGPDGAVYVSDWHDARTAHPDPDADWDRTNGRIYRLAPRGSLPSIGRDFSRLSAQELLQEHGHRNQWRVRRARQELVRRYIHGSPQAGSPAMKEEASRCREWFQNGALQGTNEVVALESLWSLHALEGLETKVTMQLLASPFADVRSWTIRLLGDRNTMADETRKRLLEIASQEAAISVRQQLACSARRFPAHQAVPLLSCLLQRDLDQDDPFQPLLLWWAVEQQSDMGLELVLDELLSPRLRESRLAWNFVLPRLIRKCMAVRTVAGLDAAIKILKAVPRGSLEGVLWENVLLGWQENPRGREQSAWLAAVQRHAVFSRVLQAWQARRNDLVLQRLAVFLGHSEPKGEAVREAFQSHTPQERRVALLELLGSTRDPALIAPALDLVGSREPEAVCAAALKLFTGLDEPRIAQRLIELHRTIASETLRSRIRDVLLARPSSARIWLEKVDRGEIAVTETPLEQIRRIAYFRDSQLDALVFRHWGKLEGTTREEKLAEVRRLNNDLRSARGDPVRGQQLFQKQCATCHQLFGQGAKIGPDLTTANRRDRDFLLVSLVDPSSVIRKEFVSIVLHTTTGRVLTGLPVARNAAAITLVDAQGVRQVIPTAEIEELQDSPVSLMPENLYQQLKPQELRDLFAYLQSK